jgi:hypothetical protein
MRAGVRIHDIREEECTLSELMDHEILKMVEKEV